MFEKAKEFLQCYGGLELNWQLHKDSYNYTLRINPCKTGVRVFHLKWYQAYFRRFLYPVAQYPAMPADLLIDTDGNFFFVNGDYVCEAGNDFLEILNNLLNNGITALGNYYKIPDWEDAGYSDEFIEQWNYDFDILK